jgi:hypothetical protein
MKSNSSILKTKGLIGAALLSMFGFVSLPTTSAIVLGAGATLVMSDSAWAKGSKKSVPGVPHTKNKRGASPSENRGGIASPRSNQKNDWVITMPTKNQY